MLATHPPTDHFNPAPHEYRTQPIETLVEADHVAPKLNEDDSFVQDLLRDGVSHENGASPVSITGDILDQY